MFKFRVLFNKKFEEMPSGYKEEVLKDYQSKLAIGDLSPNLVMPTPASIRDECLLIFADKRNKKDMNIIKMFVGNREDPEEYERALRVVSVTKFRPLQNFLLDSTIQTSNKNIELLAWLIGFEPIKKPADSPDTGDTVDSSAGDDLEVLSDKESRELSGGSVKPTSVSPGRDPAPTLIELLINHKQKVLVVIALLLTAGIGIFNKSPENQSFLSLLKPGSQCMYWNNDHYEEIDCETKPPYGQAVALERFKLDYFRKITQPDTLTLSDINKVWYLKNNHRIELYTADGNHPELVNRRLRPLTKYMFDKYVSGKMVRSK